jgi:tetratricopeptide (TPR) repeat protein
VKQHDAEGRLEAAIAAARSALAHDGTNAGGWHDLGVLYQRRGALPASRAAFERAAELDPALVSVHNNLGNTYTLLGELERAVASYRRALDVDPALVPAHANAAAALHRLGRNDEALAHARRAAALDPATTTVQITAALVEGAVLGYDAALERLDAALARDPDSAGATAARAYALLRLERFDEVVDAATRGLERWPNTGGLLETLGCALRAQLRFEEAFAVFDRALALGHDPAGMLVLKASGLLELGDFETARLALEAALMLAPDNSTAWSALAEIRPFRAADPTLDRMEKLLASTPALRAVDARTTMHFALGKAYRKAGDAANAFRHFAEGNALKRASMVYDVADDERFVRESIAFFTPATMRRLSGAGDPSRAPIFVLGMPRSGTSLVEQILAAHPGVHGAGELTLFDRAVGELGREDPAALAARYLALLDALAPGEQRVVDKLPSNFRHVGLLHLAFPRAKIVHCVRDALDTCFSCYTTLFTGRQDFSYDLAETGRYYRAYEKLMEHWRAVLPPGVMLDVRYEELVANLEAGARELLAFCELPWDDAVLRYYEAARPVRTASYHQVRQPIYASSVGAAQRYRAELGPLIDALSGKPHDPGDPATSSG